MIRKMLKTKSSAVIAALLIAFLVVVWHRTPSAQDTPPKEKVKICMWWACAGHFSCVS